MAAKYNQHLIAKENSERSFEELKKQKQKREINLFNQNLNTNKNSQGSRDRFDTNMEDRFSPDDDTLK